ncbi:acyl-CoA N-acyltransferase [Sistotremastrum niveocremeum HHB9708]|uniref:N-alpha-acetyltransferase 40 n=1 Tax=Sistotremastrum niveocremeum HHB9708 TaxID=1314777 RepID=A0A164UBT0_9AGAM|nr:acyl-CoA N-acyltransferase [Sistotremastrum niveocremeum HHB9708]
MPPRSRKVRKALRATPEELKAALDHELGRESGVQFFKSTEISNVLREEIWAILEDISGLLRTSSFGWNVQEKEEEVFHPDGRLMVLFLDSHEPENRGRVAGFCSFRFEQDEDDIIYCYELHVERSGRGNGVGGLLIAHLETTARIWGMSKIFLTCLNSNPRAFAFYTRHGQVNHHA